MDFSLGQQGAGMIKCNFGNIEILVQNVFIKINKEVYSKKKSLYIHS